MKNDSKMHVRTRRSRGAVAAGVTLFLFMLRAEVSSQAYGGWTTLEAVAFLFFQAGQWQFRRLSMRVGIKPMGSMYCTS